MFDESKYQAEFAEEERRNATRRTVLPDSVNKNEGVISVEKAAEYDRREKQARVRRIGPRRK